MRFPRRARKPPNVDLAVLARDVGNAWKRNAYYDEAESSMDEQWEGLIWPLIQDCDFTRVVELAAGHGRNSEKLKRLAERLYLVDINRENIDFLERRFAGATNIVFVHNDGMSLEAIPDGEATFVYSFDAMVHFDSDVVRAYLKEFRRVLRPRGRCFCHYSNYSANPTGSFRDHPGARNFMSRELFEHYAWKEGLTPVTSQLVPWNEDGTEIDAVTLLEKPKR